MCDEPQAKGYTSSSLLFLRPIYAHSQNDHQRVRKLVRKTIRVKPESNQRVKKYARLFNLSENPVMGLSVDTFMYDLN